MLSSAVHTEADHRLLVVLPADVDPRLQFRHSGVLISHAESTLAKAQQNKRLQHDQNEHLRKNGGEGALRLTKNLAKRTPQASRIAPAKVLK